MSSSLKNLLKTTPNDKVHYPATNQAHYCWQKYNEYVLCMKSNDGDESACKKAKQSCVSICPAEWTEKWDEQREAGNFLGVQAEGATPGHSGDAHH